MWGQRSRKSYSPTPLLPGLLDGFWVVIWPGEYFSPHPGVTQSKWGTQYGCAFPEQNLDEQPRPPSGILSYLREVLNLTLEVFLGRPAFLQSSVRYCVYTSLQGLETNSPPQGTLRPRNTLGPVAQPEWFSEQGPIWSLLWDPKVRMQMSTQPGLLSLSSLWWLRRGGQGGPQPCGVTWGPIYTANTFFHRIVFKLQNATIT